MGAVVVCIPGFVYTYLIEFMVIGLGSKKERQTNKGKPELGNLEEKSKKPGSKKSKGSAYFMLQPQVIVEWLFFKGLIILESFFWHQNNIRKNPNSFVALRDDMYTPILKSFMTQDPLQANNPFNEID
ncbi:MAG: hypothetical protein EOO00_05480 [Chitinophagaceae bacterium]|nr:MAG: hypothetical protein EOO00_05480 [Chitinophagaceae bacterium]